MRLFFLVLMLISLSAFADRTVSRRGDMVQRFYEKEFKQKYAQRKERLSRIKSREDALLYQQEVREKIRKSFGKLPEKTPLNARITGQTDMGKLLVDKVVFESRPGMEVTGLFYRPKNISGKIPGIIALCGHSAAGKLGASYQKLCQDMALRGYGVFMIDPIGQGERHYFTDEEKVTWGVMTHNMCGRQLGLLGEFFGSWRLWDAIRGLDYLLSRPEIDQSKVAVTGSSGGGTLTTYLNAFDSRLTMAAPSSYITTMMHNLQNELPVDAEQLPPGFADQGCDIADLLIAAAPRPAVILAQNNDFFDPRGAEEAFAEVRKIYELLGKGEDIQLFIGNGIHGYSAEHRAAAAKFFSRYTGLDTTPDPADIKVWPEEKLYCTPEGRVNKSGFHNAMQKAAESVKAADKRPVPEIVTDLLKLDKAVAPEYRAARPQFTIKDQRFMLNRFLLETEPGITVTLKQSSKDMIHHFAPPENVVLYIPHMSAADELEKMDLPADDSVFALEVRGIGESQPVDCDLYADAPGFFYYYGSDYLYASCGNMLERPYIGRRVQDILNTVAMFKIYGVKNIRLIGRGQGAVTAALAAVLLPEVKEVTLYNAPLSWREMTAGRVVDWPLSSMPFGVIGHIDLPEIYKHLKTKNIRLLEPWDNTMKPYQQQNLQKTARKYGLCEFAGK